MTAAGMVGITRWALWVPGLAEIAGVPLPPSAPPASAHEQLGRKGLLGKDAATRMALCAVARACDAPPAPRPADALDPRTAVVVSSNFGNLATVREVTAALARGGVREVSPLHAPVVSSNVIASNVAIWFRFGGPNLTVCAGAPGGLAAIALGARLLRADRSDRAVIVGVEPDDDIAVAASGGRLRAAAACVVLQRGAGHAVAPVAAGAPPSALGELGGGGAWRRLAPYSPDAIDLAAVLGAASGATGVAQVALAAALLDGAPPEARVTIIGGRDGDWRSTVVGGQA